MTDTAGGEGGSPDSESMKTDDVDLEALLNEKEKLDQLIKRKFTRTITVMFTDLSGSTSMAETLGDMAVRMLLKRHNEILIPLVEANNGVLVKTMGDGTMSYFKEAVDGVRAAIAIELAMQEFNQTEGTHPLNIRCGLNTGVGIVEKNDVYGDVVNVSQRFEALAKPFEILISQETYERVKDVEDLTISYLRQEMVKGKAGPQSVYRVAWSDDPPDGSNAEMQPTADLDLADAASQVAAGSSEVAQRPSALITVERDGHSPESHDLGEKPVVIGRSPQADIKIPELFLSRKHARIEKIGNDFFLEDLKSHIGTMVNGKKISRIKLSGDARFNIGSVTFIFTRLDEKTEAERDDNDFRTTGLPGDIDIDATVAFQAGSILILALQEQGQTVESFELSSKELTIGRKEGCDIRLQSPLVSRRHAKIIAENGAALIEDLDSNNGTYVRGVRIDKDSVGHGDEIRIGPFSIIVLDPLKPPPVPKHSSTDGVVSSGPSTASNMVNKAISFFKKK